MNPVFSKIVVFFLSVVIIAYVISQALANFYDPYEAEIVQKGTYVQELDLNGFFIRSEKVLSQQKNGVVRYHYRNAEKIAKQGVVASIYSREQDLRNLEASVSLTRQREILLEAQNRENIEGVKLDLLSKEITEDKLELISCIDERNFTDLEALSAKLMLNMGKFAVCVDNSISYDNAIAQLDQRIAQLNAQIPQNTPQIIAEESGYFANVVDGYETDFTPEMLEKLTINQAESWLTEQRITESNQIGKVVTEDIWYFAAVISRKEADLFRKGRSLHLKFDSKSTRTIPVTVQRIITERNNEKAVVIFESDYLDEDLITMRFESPQVILGTHSGIIIPKQAIRMENMTNEDGSNSMVKGVYTQLGKTVRFKKVDPVYEDDYVLVSKPNIDATQYVSIYDQVIVKGKNLNETTR